MMQASPSKSLPVRFILITLAIVLVVFHLGLIFSGLTSNLVSRPVHMALALPWILIFSKRAGTENTLFRLSGWLLAAAGIVSCLYIALNHSDLIDQYGFLEGNWQVVMAIALIVVVLEAARRAIGWPLPIVAFIALMYGLFGQYIPGEFGHSPCRSTHFSAP